MGKPIAKNISREVIRSIGGLGETVKLQSLERRYTYFPQQRIH